VAYCKWLSQKTGRQYRLPTEAEWEYAARGGQPGIKDDFKYAGSNDIGAVAWYASNSGSKTHPVGEKAKNQLGLYDMSGNVHEWCSDWYASDYYHKSPAKDPKGPGSGSSRVCRGGSWNINVNDCRSANRNLIVPTYRNFSIGFRVAQDK